ncbi:MAG TPA: glycosyltransferase family 2 protein [Bacteroidales bacterium]|nr:glycosyltransferase family 2 protein [Bacteroidales bacterium]
MGNDNSTKQFNKPQRFYSIITICRNNLNELKQTFYSIKDQSFRDFEWIVIDGNSNDGTKDWLKNNRLARWTSEPDNGIFDAMNKGLSKASGKYVIFMNSGDQFANNEVLDQVYDKASDTSMPGFIYGDSLDVDENKVEHYRKAKNHTMNWRGMITQHQAMFFSRNAVGKISYQLRFPVTADYAFISEVLGKLDDGEILQVDFPICKFDMGGTNEQQRIKALKEDKQIRVEIIGMSKIKAKVLYLLHYLHTVLKKTNPSIRFAKHQKQNDQTPS